MTSGGQKRQNARSTILTLFWLIGDYGLATI